MGARTKIDLQIAEFRGVGQNVEAALLGRNPTRPIHVEDEILFCAELDTESSIATCKDVTAGMHCARNGYVHNNNAPTSTAWKGLIFFARQDGGEKVFDALCLKAALVTGGAGAAQLTCTGIETEDTLLGVFEFTTAASVASMKDITHLCSIPAAAKVACSAATTNNHLLVFWHDANGVGYDYSNLRFALVDGTTADTDIACADANSNAIAVADVVIFCLHITTKASVATLADLTSECHATHTAGSIQMETTDTSNDQLLLIWQDVA
jgi:hypothetical protein